MHPTQVSAAKRGPRQGLHGFYSAGTTSGPLYPASAVPTALVGARSGSGSLGMGIAATQKKILRWTGLRGEESGATSGDHCRKGFEGVADRPGN